MINPQLGEKILDPSCGTGGYLTCTIDHLKKQANSVEERQSIAKNIWLGVQTFTLFVSYNQLDFT